MVNFGGHNTASIQSKTFMGTPIKSASIYSWQGISRVGLLPSLTSALLFSFALASIVRYRPELLAKTMSSPMNLLVDIFIQESPAFMIPSFRNLLYREELTIEQVSCI